jgi:hypothetical protein
MTISREFLVTKFKTALTDQDYAIQCPNFSKSWINCNLSPIKFIQFLKL